VGIGFFDKPDARLIATSAAGNSFGFQGMPKDPETGFVYFRNRYYDPELGRFITADPKGYVDGPSMYAFEKGDPVNGTDPLGLCDGFSGCAQVAWDTVVEWFSPATPAKKAGKAVNESIDQAQKANATYNANISRSHNQASAPEDIDSRTDEVRLHTLSHQRFTDVGQVFEHAGKSGWQAAAAGVFGLDATTRFRIFRDAVRAAAAAGKSAAEQKVAAEAAVAKAEQEAAGEGTAAAERAANLEKGIPASELGPSGKPKIHVVQHSTRKEAEDAARAEAGKGGTAIQHPTPAEGGPHFHGETQNGAKKRTHHQYPD